MSKELEVKKFDFSKKVLDINNVPIKPFKDYVAEILLAAAPDDAPMYKHRYYTMAIKIITSMAPIPLDEEEISFIISKAERVAPPLVVGRLHEFLKR